MSGSYGIGYIIIAEFKRAKLFFYPIIIFLTVLQFLELTLHHTMVSWSNGDGEQSVTV